MQAYWKTFLRKLVPGIAVVLHALAANAAEPASSSSTFPARTVQIIVGFSPGGLPDIAARLIAPALATVEGAEQIMR